MQTITIQISDEDKAEAIALSGITTTGWVPCYDGSGNYIGKIPVFT